MTQEDALAYMDGDEIVEVTPGSVTLRKIVLDQAKRARMKGGRSRWAVMSFIECFDSNIANRIPLRIACSTTYTLISKKSPDRKSVV